MSKPTNDKIRQAGTFGGSKRHVYEFTEPTNVVAAHSCLLPKFSITLRVGELRKLLANLEDDDGLTVTVADQQAATFTFVR